MPKTETQTPTRTTERPLMDPETTRSPERWCPQQRREAGWEGA